jgi:hypothetical protein
MALLLWLKKPFVLQVLFLLKFEQQHPVIL